MCFIITWQSGQWATRTFSVILNICFYRLFVAHNVKWVWYLMFEPVLINTLLRRPSSSPSCRCLSSLLAFWASPSKASSSSFLSSSSSCSVRSLCSCRCSSFTCTSPSSTASWHLTVNKLQLNSQREQIVNTHHNVVIREFKFLPFVNVVFFLSW